MPLIRYTIDSIDLQAKIKRLGFTQRALAKYFNVTDGAISQAINNYQEVENLRKRLIQYLNSLQANKTNSLKTTKTKEVA